MKISDNIQPYLNYSIIRTIYVSYLNARLKTRGHYTLYYYDGWRLLGINCP